MIYYVHMDLANDPDPQKDFFYGAAGAFVTVGVFSDLFLQGKSQYLLMGVFTVFEIVNAFVLLFFKDTGEWKFYLLGYLQTLIHVL